MQVRFLPRVVAASPGRPERTGAAESQARSRALAAHPSHWSSADVHEVIDAYDRLAPVWDEERGAYRATPLRDALDRGGRMPAGPCVEVGAGTGLLTPLLAAVWSRVICVDLSSAMLSRSTIAWRVRADAAQLPIASHSVAAVVLADAPLFAPEVRRVLRSDGIVVWSNALGDAAPHYVPAEELVTALSVPGQSWRATASEAGWGSWAVLRRD